MNARVEETTVPGRRAGSTVRRWRAACLCGFVTEWRSSRKAAQERADTHAREFCVNPGPIRVGVFEPGSPEWHQARASRLGGSEVAAVLGLSKWESRFSLWHRKAGLYVEDRDNDEMRAGRVFEDAIAGLWRKAHPEWGLQQKVGTWVHARRPWQLANPDGLIHMDGAPGLLEVKFALYDFEWGEAGTDEVPIYYRVQAQWYLDVFGLTECRFAVFFGGSARFREYVVKADPEDQAMLREAAAGFLADVAAGVRPDIDGHDATYDVVKALHPQIQPESVPVPDDLAVAFIGAQHAKVDAEAEAKRWTARIADHMGSAEKATWAGRVIASRQAKSGGTPYVVKARNLPRLDEINLEAAS